jgi:hypothetical protein
MRVRSFGPALALAVALSGLSAAVAAPVPSAAPAPVDRVPQADEVVVTTARWAVGANSSGYQLRFTRDGAAVYDGPLHGYDGHYIAKTDFVAVEAEVEHAKLCEGSGIPLFVPVARPLHGMQAPMVLVRVRCGDIVKTYNDTVAADLPAFAQALLALGRDLPWLRTGPAQRETIVRFIH